MSARTAAVGWADAVTEAIGRWVLVLTGVPRPELVPRVGRTVIAAGGGLTWGPLPALGAAALAWWLPAFLATRRRRARLAQLDAAVPELAELLLVALGAGAAPHQALGRVARWAPPVLAPELDRAAAMLAAGRPLAEVLDRLGRLSPALAVLTGEVAAAVRTGAPLAEVLSRLADDGRRLARQESEAAARRLPVVLLFPLTCCILPAFGLLTVGPALAAGLRTLQP